MNVRRVALLVGLLASLAGVTAWANTVVFCRPPFTCGASQENKQCFEGSCLEATSGHCRSGSAYGGTENWCGGNAPSFPPTGNCPGYECYRDNQGCLLCMKCSGTNCGDCTYDMDCNGTFEGP